MLNSTHPSSKRCGPSGLDASPRGDPPGFLEVTVGTVAWSLLVACFLASCGGGSSGGGEATVTGTTVRTTLKSSRTGVTYPIYIYLPVDYDTSQGSFPAIYALDGDLRFAAMSNVLAAEKSKVILVAIGHDDLRGEDYLMPGAEAYYGFITQDVIPFVEAKYRVRADRRGLAGHSLGGLFVGFALFMDRLKGSYFYGFISQDGSLVECLNNSCPSRVASTINTMWSMEQQVYDSGNPLPVGLVVSGATCCAYELASDFYDRVVSRGYQGLNAKKLLPYMEDHIGMFAPSFRDSVRFLFP